MNAEPMYRVIFQIRNYPGDFGRDWGDWDAAPLDVQRARFVAARAQWRKDGYSVDYATAIAQDGSGHRVELGEEI